MNEHAVDRARVAVLVNPSAGHGRGATSAPHVMQGLRARGFDPIDIRGRTADEAVEALRRSVSGAPDGHANVAGVVACGGDGTVHLALQVVVERGIPLGIVATGSGDDNARMMGLPRGDAGAATRIIADALDRGTTRHVDVAHVCAADDTCRWFLGVMSAGFDSAVNERANRMTWPKGQAKYVGAILAELRSFVPVPYVMTMDGLTVARDGMLVAVGNGSSYGGGMRVCPSASVEDGLLSVTFLARVSKPTFLRVFPRVFRGTHVTHPAVSTYEATRIVLDGPRQIAYADGERIGPLPCRVSVRAGGLQLLA